MIRAVFDTNVLYSAILKPAGQEARAFALVIAALVIPCISDPVIDEYYDVLFRPELSMHIDRVRQVLDILVSVAMHVTPSETLKISGHEEDNRIYECAHEARADYIITGNTKHFPESIGMTQIVNAGQLLRLIAAGEK